MNFVYVERTRARGALLRSDRPRATTRLGAWSGCGQLLVASLLLFGTGACTGDTPAPRSEAACTPSSGAQPITFEESLAAGPYAVGQAKFTFVDESRTTQAHGGEPELDSRTLPTEVWYPATEAGVSAPLAAGGPFPLVVYSHGFSSINRENPTLAAHLASRGYVVFAPRFPLSHLNTPGGATGIDIPDQPLDVGFIIDSALGLGADAESVLAGGIDPERIAAVGLSYGGLTTLLASFHPTLHDPRIKIMASLAPPASFLGEAFFDTRVVPALIVHGTMDAVVRYEPNAPGAFERANPPMHLYTLADGTHTAFTFLWSLLGSQTHADEGACGVLTSGEPPPPTPDGGVSWSRYDALGGAEAGLIDVTDEGIFCQPPFERAMRPARQMTLTLATVGTFLDSYFHPDAAERGRACHFQESVLPNEEDLTFRRK